MKIYIEDQREHYYRDPGSLNYVKILEERGPYQIHSAVNNVIKSSLFEAKNFTYSRGDGYNIRCEVIQTAGTNKYLDAKETSKTWKDWRIWVNEKVNSML